MVGEGQGSFQPLNCFCLDGEIFARQSHLLYYPQHFTYTLQYSSSFLSQSPPQPVSNLHPTITLSQLHSQTMYHTHKLHYNPSSITHKPQQEPGYLPQPYTTLPPHTRTQSSPQPVSFTPPPPHTLPRLCTAPQHPLSPTPSLCCIDSRN